MKAEITFELEKLFAEFPILRAEQVPEAEIKRAEEQLTPSTTRKTGILFIDFFAASGPEERDLDCRSTYVRLTRQRFGVACQASIVVIYK
ncbi:MAG: hypothetical protein AAFU77_04570 [Myxococcota bacterium]